MHRYFWGMSDRRVLFSSLWVFAMFNYLYADVMGLMDATLLRQYLTGTVNGMSVDRPMLFGAAVLMEIPIAMVVIARVAPYAVNRWANLAAGTLKSVVVLATLFVGTPSGYYLFFASIEVACTTFIAVSAWWWRDASDAGSARVEGQALAESRRASP